MLIVEIDRAVLDEVALTQTDQQRLVYSANRMNVRHWIEHTRIDPNRPVPPNLSPEMFQITREQVRIGIDQIAERAYRTGQQQALRLWMKVLFQLPSDTGGLHDALDHSLRSIGAFVDATLGGLRDQMAREQAMISESRHAERQQLVMGFLEGTVPHATSVGRQLRYRMERTHCAHVVWRRPGDLEAQGAEYLAQALIEMAGVTETLMIMADTETCWLWLPEALPVNALGALAGTTHQIAQGDPLTGPEGFRRSLAQARTAWGIMTDTDFPVARYQNVRAMSVVSADPIARASFVAECLGALKDAPETLRTALRTYLRHGSNAVEAARALNLHRNTLLQQLARAKDLLPAPLTCETNLVVLLALEISHWDQD